MTLPAVAILDTGPLYAALDAGDPDHARCVAALNLRGVRPIIPALVVAEVSYLAQTRLGPSVEALFLSDLSRHDVVAPEADDWLRIAELVREYADFPLGGTDASVIALAERLRTPTVITLDRRHFAAVRPRHCASLQLLPD